MAMCKSISEIIEAAKKQQASENNRKYETSEIDMSDSRAMQFYFENRAKINNLYNVAQTVRNWFQSIFCDSCFVWEHRVANPVRTKRPEDKHRYAVYRLPDIDELVVVVNYEGLWNSNSGEACLRFYFEPLEPWIEPVVNNETRIRSGKGFLGMSSKNKDKRFWHCGSLEFNIPEATLQSEKKLKDCIARILLDPESRLVMRARETANILSKKHKPSYQWEEALYVLQQLAPRDDEDNAWLWENRIDFVSFDENTHIVVLEVLDNLHRSHIECYDNCLTTAIRYAFGEEARYTIMCRQLMH